jgi:iron(III) transport system substrate-binding protein
MSLKAIRQCGCALIGAICLLAAANALAANAPMSSAQLALYQGADREKILIEGAKQEGQFTLYDSHTWFRTIAREFEKKYPFVKVSEWRSDGRNLIKRALEEIRAGQYIADIIATTSEQMALMKREGVFQEYTLADARHYPDEVKAKGKPGFTISGITRPITA